MKPKSIDAVIERLEHLREDIREIKDTVTILHEDYIKRQSVQRFFFSLVAAVAAIVSWITANILDKYKF